MSTKKPVIINNLSFENCPEGFICALGGVDLEGISSPENVIGVPIRYRIGDQCIEGVIPFAELANLLFTTGTPDDLGQITGFSGLATSGSTARIRVTEDSVDRDVYLSGDNVSFSGSGSTADPLVISVAPPAPVAVANELELTLDPSAPEVVGANYHTIQAAYDYALTVLVAGGRLTLDVADNQTISEPASLFIDGTLIGELLIFGSNSQVNLNGGQFQMSRGSFRTSGVTYNLTAGSGFGLIFGIMDTLQLQNASYTGNHSFAAVAVSDADSMIIRNFDVTGNGRGFYVARSRGSISNCDINITSSDAIAVDFHDQATADVRTNNISFPVGSTNTTGISALRNSRIITSTPNAFDGNETTQFDPPANTDGNFMSRIQTSA